MPITVTIPAPTGTASPGDGILVKNDHADRPDGAGMIVFVGDLSVYRDLPMVNDQAGYPCPHGR